MCLAELMLCSVTVMCDKQLKLAKPRHELSGPYPVVTESPINVLKYEFRLLYLDAVDLDWELPRCRGNRGSWNVK